MVSETMLEVMCMQTAAAATQFNADPYSEADKKLGLKISPHILDHSLPASKISSVQKLQLLLIFK
jgi:hypothetical protein